METMLPKVEFVLGSEVSPSHFFKSSYARSVAETSARDSKSLDYDFLDNGTIAEESGTGSGTNDGNNNFYSLVNFGSESGGGAVQPSSAVWSSAVQRQPVQQQPRQSLEATVTYNGGTGDRLTALDQDELEKLRKRCQTLMTENEKLRLSLRSQQTNGHQSSSGNCNQNSSVQLIDTVYLQNQVDTLQWQLKQSEASRDMYRSTMEQVARFLDRSRKSLAIMCDKLPATLKNSKATMKDKSRVPRSRSVHAVHGVGERLTGGSSASFASSTMSTSSSNSSSSSSTSSRTFGRAKSVAQISAVANGGGERSSVGSSFKDFTWSVLRRNVEPPKAKPPPPPVQDTTTMMMNASLGHEATMYRRPKQVEVDPDEVPPEKLAQEAFRLMRTVQSLLMMREPDLARVSAVQDVSISPSPLDQLNMSSLSLHHNFVNSTALQENGCQHHHHLVAGGSSSSDRGIEGSSGGSSCYTDDETNRTVYNGGKVNTVANTDSTSSEQTLLSPGARQSIDAASLNSSASSKNTEDEERNFSPLSKHEDVMQLQNNGYSFTVAPISSTPIGKKIRRLDRKDHLKSLKEWALGNSSSSVTSRPKPATSVSSAEDESGFSSMSSFQEVGLPHVTSNVPTAVVKGGCHTEVGLPEVPIEKIRHRRWSSTPAEFQALYKRHSGSFASGGQNTETVSVWV